MSIRTDAKVDELEGRVVQLESVVKALNMKLEAVEKLTIPRPKRSLRDITDREDNGRERPGTVSSNN